jgi:hypothetical protein
MDVSIASWYANLGTSVQAAFNTTAMTNLSPAQIIFDSATAYREAQEMYNSTAPSGGPYINFASPISEDSAPSVDSTGAISKNKRIILQAKTVFSPNPQIQPQQSIVII